ncbi:MAG: hypothetical protein ACKV2V_00980, partial [Blastocatellia bacterium]
PQAFFSQQYIAAQISLGLAGWRFDILWSSLSCYGKQIPQTVLSNGAVINGNSMVNELYDQALLAARNGNPADQLKLGAIFEILNGHRISGICND